MAKREKKGVKKKKPEKANWTGVRNAIGSFDSDELLLKSEYRDSQEDLDLLNDLVQYSPNFTYRKTMAIFERTRFRDRIECRHQYPRFHDPAVANTGLCYAQNRLLSVEGCDGSSYSLPV